MKILQGLDNTFYYVMDYVELTKSQAEDIAKHAEHDLAMAKRFLEEEALKATRTVEHALENDLANQGVDMPDQQDQNTTTLPADVTPPASQDNGQPAQDTVAAPAAPADPSLPPADPNAQPAPSMPAQPAPTPTEQPAPAYDANGNLIQNGQPQEPVLPPFM